MKRKKIVSRVVPFLMVLVNLALSVAVVFLMGHVQNLLNSDVKINLTEIVTQNKDAITSKLMMNVNALDFAATKVSESLKVAPGTDEEGVQKALRLYARGTNTMAQFIVDRNGAAWSGEEKFLDVSGRKYFRLALEGIPNISDRIISRVDGKEVFVIAVPLTFENKTIGTIQRVYSQEEFYQLCSLSLFSSQGYMYIINSEGYIILHSAHKACQQRSDNYFRDLFASGNSEASEKIKNDIQNNHNGFTETTIDNESLFSAYTPIDKIHDWYLITSVPNNAVSPNGNTVIKLFYTILFVIVFIFTSIMAYFLWYKNRQRVNLERIAFVDTVTGGNTFNKFVVDVKDAFEANPEKSFYIMKFDIDNFKYINNFYGFEFGDTILCHVTDNIRQQLGPHESIARVSSDHFVALLDNIEKDRLTHLLSTLEDEESVTSFSVGIYAITDRNESINLMVDKASTAAQSIKNMLNERIVIYSDKFEQQAIHNEQMKRAIKQAIEEEEFVAFYQPKVNVLDGTLTGGEALVRWKTKEGKFIYPNEFIPVSEQTGLIVQIDMIVYEKVLRLLRSFLDQDVPCVPISVNFSRLHLLNPDFIGNIVEKQLAYGVPAHLIEIELTESAIFDNVESIYAFTEEMHKNGFLIAMDDFGSGYSSLNMLKDIPIDILKIDKDFLGEARDNNRRNIIFSSIAEMARNLNIKVVVEGVEHLENVQLMKDCGCFIAQGYYFAKPMEEELFAHLFREGRVC